MPNTTRELMVHRTKLLKKEFEQIAQIYAIGFYLRHKLIEDALGNTNYHFWTTTGEYFVKIFETENVKSIAYENLIHAKLKSKFPVPELLKTSDKKECIILQEKLVVVMKKLNGKHIRDLNKSQIVNLAQIIAKMHKKLATLKIKGREDLESATEFCLWMPKNNEKLNAQISKLTNKIRKLKLASLPKQIIHADLHATNILFKNDKISGILDWGDAHKDYRAYDIATTLTMFFVRDSINQEAITLFMRNYTKINPLSSTEKRAILVFMQKRLLEIIGWHMYQQEHFPEKSAELKETVKKVWMRYNLLKSAKTSMQPVN